MFSCILVDEKAVGIATSLRVIPRAARPHTALHVRELRPKRVITFSRVAPVAGSVPMPGSNSTSMMPVGTEPMSRWTLPVSQSASNLEAIISAFD